MTGPREAVKAGVGTVSGAAGAVRRRRPFIDHTVRAYGRYTSDGGDRLAASTTYFAFLSFFPIVALVFSIAGFVVDAYPDAQAKLTEQINDYLPGLADRLDVSTIGHAKVGAGLIGLAGLLLAGLAWVSALRDSIRLVWHQSLETGNFIVQRLRDIAILTGLGLTLLASLVVTSLATSATGVFLRWVGLEGSTAAAWATGLLALVVALAIDAAVFVYIFWRLPERTNRQRVLRAAALGAVGIELLKLLGTWLVGQTTSNPVYGIFAVMVGLLIWINIVMRWMLFVAAWAVTAPYASDVHPSGTAPADPAGPDLAGADGPGPEGDRVAPEPPAVRSARSWRDDRSTHDDHDGHDGHAGEDDEDGRSWRPRWPWRRGAARPADRAPVGR
ncbi:YihY/virulence factor BrkB family protein [Parafrankia sp. BMG5.11]|uniref:YihY/virulence factor BrkB family protein n=1 Tax=Parafrankia sp. BMG5.11 TaxID=222540 RepID=UPI000DD2FA79|nr:YihY/virulence factor BrkB family protein [Parafrankia sp. BMG5.11]TCJ32771.1 YihY/virulence factor BrkB family protein [Parafrankia sp. BMG5.11]